MRGCLRIGCGAAVVCAVIAVIIIVLVLVLGGGKTATTKPLTGHVGTTLHVPDNLDVTLLSVRASAGNTVETPKTGNEYLITTWRFHNFRTSNTDVAQTGFTAQSKGVITNPEFVSILTQNELGSAGTSLAPGATVQRDIVFQVVKGDPRVQLIYKPGDVQATWTVHG